MRQASRRETQTYMLVVPSYWTKVQDSHFHPLTLGSSRRQMWLSCLQLTAPATWVKVEYSNIRSLNFGFWLYMNETKRPASSTSPTLTPLLGAKPIFPKKERCYSCTSCNISSFFFFFFWGGGGGGGTKKSHDPGQHAARFRDLGQYGVQESLYNKISSGFPTLTLVFGVSSIKKGCYN